MVFPPIVIPTFNRLALLKQSLDSLERSKHGEVLIVDDCSSQATADYLMTTPYEVEYGDENLGADRNSYECCCMMAERYDHFVISNSDFIYHPDWLITLERIYQENRGNRLAAISPFLHQQPSADCRSVGDCYEVKHITGVQLIVSSFWRSLQNRIDQTLWDLSLTALARSEGYQLLVTRESWVQHIGLLEGVHMERPDVGLFFKGEQR